MRIDITLWSMLVLIILFLSARNRFDFRSESNRLLFVFIGSTALACAFDILGWLFEGQPGHLALIMNQIGNVLLYIINLVPISIWLFYTQTLTSQKTRLFKISTILVQTVLVVNSLLAVVSLKTGWYFSVSPDNHYVRGPLFLVHASMALGIVVLSSGLIVLHRKLIPLRMTGLLLTYYAFPLVGSLIQIRFYGVSVTWPMTTLSVLFIYQHIIDNHLTTDYLTGTLNRRHFEKLMARKLVQTRPDQYLALIAADIDHFKQINDRYGHGEGDRALQATVQILHQCLRHDDIIARVGGDEFYIILQSRSWINLDQTLARFHQAFAHYNETSGKPFTLQLSFGGVVYDKASHPTVQTLLEHADRRMYENKSMPAMKRTPAL
ncbi:MAG: GGDEF domain-containing protein [Eubacteriales bacterium]|nr:GGDEF domain-containing protein [Eubacteriales bacterium]